MQVSATRQIEISDSGNDVFSRIKNGNGYFVTNYATANTGTGVIEIGNVTDPAAWNYASNNKNLELQFSVIAGVTTYRIYDSANSVYLTASTAYTSGLPILLEQPNPPAASARELRRQRHDHR